MSASDFRRPKESKDNQPSEGQRLFPGIPSKWADVLLSGGNFNDLVSDHGMEFEYYSSASCPNFIANTQEHQASCDNPFCSDGNLYIKKDATVNVVVMGSQGKKQFEAGGVYDYYAAVGLFPVTDTLGNSLIVSPQDKIIPIDTSILAVTTESFMVNSTGPLTRLKYPIINVEFMTDKDGRFYKCGEDFSLENGRIKWVSAQKPVFDPITRRGQFLSIRYTYRPYFIVSAAMSSDLRIHSGLNLATMEKENIRLPQSFTLLREYHQSYKGDRDGDATADDRGSMGTKSILPK